MIDLDITPSPRRRLNVFYLIDTSRSMEGQKIECVNQTMLDIIKRFAEINRRNQDNAEIFISCLSFSTESKWMYNVPVSANAFKWVPLTTCGVTNFGQMCRVLEKALHRGTDDQKGFMYSATGHKSPCIILLSDGEPTDDWKSKYYELKNNSWFKASSKIAIAIGDDADKNVLAEFVGSKEQVIEVKHISELEKMINFASCSSLSSIDPSINPYDPPYEVLYGPPYPSEPEIPNDPWGDFV